MSAAVFAQPSPSDFAADPGLLAHLRARVQSLENPGEWAHAASARAAKTVSVGAAAIDAAAEALLDDVDADADSLLSNVPSFCSDSAGDGSEHRPPPPADWSFSSSDDEYAPVPVAAGLSGALPQ